jgi:hypothetical protein
MVMGIPHHHRDRLPSNTGSRTPSVSAMLHERIATHAFENDERRIRHDPLDDWLQTEQEILGQQRTRNADMPHRGGYASEEQD